MDTPTIASSDPNKLPWLRRYSFVLFILLLISIVTVSVKRSAVAPGVWSAEISLGVSAITLTLLLLLAAPVIIPWLIQLGPSLQAFFVWTRKAGIEEVGISLLHLKLKALTSDGVAEAAKTYETDILQSNANAGATAQNPASVTATYKQVLETITTKIQISRGEAIQRIEKLSAMYDDVRTQLPSGPERKDLLKWISSVMFSLMAGLKEFDVEERISGDSGGRRLAAYKYIEAKGCTDQLDLLLSRAMGIWETPFGQYAALLALDRVVSEGGLAQQDRERILNSLRWSRGLSYMFDSDEEPLMRSIVERLTAGLQPVTG